MQYRSQNARLFAEDRSVDLFYVSLRAALDLFARHFVSLTLKCVGKLDVLGTKLCNILLELLFNKESHDGRLVHDFFSISVNIYIKMLSNVIIRNLHNCHYTTIILFPLMCNNFRNLSSPPPLIACKNICILMSLFPICL
jgi:hypothetical protein